MSKNTVKGRLNRESNEVPNTIPGYNPQFFDENGYATDISPRNPLPTADYGMTEGGLWIPKKVSDDGAQHTHVTGSIEGLDFSLVDEIIPPGARVDLFFPPSSKPTQYKKVNIIIRLNARADYSIEVMNLISGSITGYNSLYNVTNSNYEVVEHEMLSDLIRIRFINNGDEDISLYGYKIVGVI